MYTISITIALILVALIMGQALLAAGFVTRLRRPPAPPLSDNECPKVALIICIRGKDPTLLECLNGALNQDYPDYHLHVVVDSSLDPAWPFVTRVIAANPQTPSNVQTLKDPLHTCSLKCSSLIQAISSLDESYEVVALLDSDVIPNHCWLRNLVGPLADPKVGATTGHRWFVPIPNSFTNLARHAANAASVVLMYWLGIASGCSLAIKRSVIEEGRLLKRWANAYGEDTSLTESLNDLRLRLQIVPSAMLLEHEDCDLTGLKAWLTRQLISCRLHHAGWRAVLAHGFGTSLVLALASVTLGAAVFGQRWEEIAPLTGALAAYLLTMMGLLARLNSVVSKSRQARPSRLLTKWDIAWKLLPSIALAQMVYFVALVNALSARTVKWRGVRYQLSNSGSLRMAKHPGSYAEETSHPPRRSAGISGM